MLATTFAGGLAVALREIASFFGDKGKLVMITVSVFFVGNYSAN